MGNPHTTSPEPAIEVHDLRRPYGAPQAVRGVSFEVVPQCGLQSDLTVAGPVEMYGRDPREREVLAASRQHDTVAELASALYLSRARFATISRP